LPPINTHAKPAEIYKWKNSGRVRRCHMLLFRPIMDGEATYMDCILKKVCGSNRAAQIQAAYAIGICETFLDPKIEHIQMSETIMKKKTQKNLVSSKSYVKII